MQLEPHEAAESFTTICTQPMTERPLLHWYWRVFARLGLAEAAFAAGDLARAREEKQRSWTPCLSSMNR